MNRLMPWMFLVVVVMVLFPHLSSPLSPRLPYRHSEDETVFEAAMDFETEEDGEDDFEFPDLRVSPPCPRYQDISPCTCMNYSTGRTYVDCIGILDVSVAYRALHAPGYGPNPSSGFTMAKGTVKNIPLGFFSEVSFETIALTDNEIETVEAGSLTPLMFDVSSFYINNNKLTYPLVEMFLGFTSIREFHQSGNLITDISSLPNIPGTIPSIVTFDLAGNQITSIPPNAFRVVPKTLILVLTDNQISYIDPDAFVDLPELDYLLLDGNRLNRLGSPEVGRIVVMRPPTNLDLASNEVMEFLPGWAEGIGDPTNLVMDKNPMRDLPEDVFGDVLRTISISDYPDAYSGLQFHGNWIDCGCDFVWVVRDYNLWRHVKGGYCGNKSERPWQGIDEIDGGALIEECRPPTTTQDPSGPKRMGDGLVGSVRLP